MVANHLDSQLPTIFLGPHKSAGALPALFYFCSSAEESLTVDPFNQPLHPLSALPLRVYSWTLPCHGQGYDHAKGVPCWAEHLAQQHDLLTPFFDKAVQTIQELISAGWIQQEHMAAAGLSRGAFAALHIAAREPRIHSILGFAPVTDLLALSSFHEMALNPLVAKLSLHHQLSSLATRRHRYYMSNRDTAVSTDSCFQWVRKLSEQAYQQGVRSPPIEMVVYPPIGHRGHGTPSHIFQEGAQWLSHALLGKENR